MKIQYINRTFHKATFDLINLSNKIITEYQLQGYNLTLRQLYYQLVSRDFIPSDQKTYERLGRTINDARLAGLVDWEAIVDRTRQIYQNTQWASPQEILRAAANTYTEDHWIGQDWRPEVWIEKDALLGVIANTCKQYDVPYFSCRGFTSQSAMWEAGHNRLRTNQTNLIIHLADHDPSGIDMSRDLLKRLTLFTGIKPLRVKRIALNMDQVKIYTPPPNPTKLKDSRARGYITKYGNSCWELDALEPKVIAQLIKDTIIPLIDPIKWEKVTQRIQTHRESLRKLKGNFN